MADINPRVEIEQGIVDLLAPLRADKRLKWLEAIGGQDYELMLRAAIGAPPFAVVKYVGKTGTMRDGGYVHYQAEVSVLVGAKSFKNLSAQRQAVYELLDELEVRLGGVRLPSAGGDGVYWPLMPTAEQWSQISGGGIEVWEQRWIVQWRQDFGRP